MNTSKESAIAALRARSLTGDVCLLNTDAPRQAPEQAETLRQWRDTKDSNEAFETNPWWPRAIAVLVLLAIACIALAPEIAGLLSALFH